MTLFAEGMVLEIIETPYQLADRQTGEIRSGVSRKVTVGSGVDFESIKWPEKVELPAEGDRIRVGVMLTLQEQPGNLLQPLRLVPRALGWEPATVAEPVLSSVETPRARAKAAAGA